MDYRNWTQSWRVLLFFIINFRDLLDSSELVDDKEEPVEKIFQKYESEIKTHIKINKDMTATIENLNKKVDDLYEKNNAYYSIIKV